MINMILISIIEDSTLPINGGIKMLIVFRCG